MRQKRSYSGETSFFSYIHYSYAVFVVVNISISSDHVLFTSSTYWNALNCSISYMYMCASNNQRVFSEFLSKKQIFSFKFFVCFVCVLFICSFIGSIQTSSHLLFTLNSHFNLKFIVYIFFSASIAFSYNIFCLPLIAFNSFYDFSIFIQKIFFLLKRMKFYLLFCFNHQKIIFIEIKNLQKW